MANNNQIYNEIEQNIKKSLNEGLNSGDFRSLNIAITESVKEVMKEAGTAFGASMSEAAKGMAYKKTYATREETEAYARMLQERRKAHNEQVARENALRAERQRQQSEQIRLNALKAKKDALPVKFIPVGSSSSTSAVVAGAIGMVLSGYSLIQNGVFMMLGQGHVISTITALVFTCGFGLVLRSGITNKNLLDRAKRYAQLSGTKMYSQISDLSSAMGVTTKKIKKDIKRMLKKGIFPEGYLDDEETTLILSTDVYKQYQTTKKYSLETNAEKIVADMKPGVVEGIDDEAFEKLSDAEKTKLYAMIKSGNEYIERLHQLNNDIPGEEITRKLNELEGILKEIFRSVKLHPEQMDRMNKLMDYYLPTMIKLVEAYAEYDKVSAPAEDIIEAKKEIEQTLETINEAFVQLLNNLFQDSVWDVTTDAQVLKTMLKQEGLAKDLSE